MLYLFPHYFKTKPKLKKSILSLSVMSLLLGTVSTNAFAASGDHTLYSKSAYAYTHSSYGGGRIETNVRLRVTNSFHSRITLGYTKKVTYGAMSNGVTSSSGHTAIGSQSTHKVQSQESYYRSVYKGNWN